MNALNENKEERAASALMGIGQCSRKQALARLCEHFPDMFAAHPVENYIQLLDSTQGGKSMYFSSPEVTRFRSEMIRDWGEAALEIYHRVTMLQLINSFNNRARIYNYPDSIYRQFLLNFGRIDKKIMQGAIGTYPHTGDTFLKDFAMCLQTAFPGGGAWVVDPWGGFTRSVLFTGGVRQFFRLAWLYLFVTRGHQPMYSMHIHNDQTKLHTPEERMACHLRLVEMMERNPHVKGINGCSWLTDPVLQEISPKLQWVRTIPEANGCLYFRVGEDIDGGALTRSKTRRELYEQGKYMPTRYLNIWPRNSMLAWARGVTQGTRYRGSASVTMTPGS